MAPRDGESVLSGGWGGEVVEGNMSCHGVLMLDQEMDNI